MPSLTQGGMTPLMISALEGRDQCLSFLLSRGANCNAVNVVSLELVVTFLIVLLYPLYIVSMEIRVLALQA
jgi:ankyrin repeat protein